MFRIVLVGVVEQTDCRKVQCVRAIVEDADVDVAGHDGSA